MLFKEVYQGVENPHEQDAGIEIISGEWEGLVYQYGDVQFVDGEPPMNFKRTIRRLPKGVEVSEEAIGVPGASLMQKHTNTKKIIISYVTGSENE